MNRSYFALFVALLIHLLLLLVFFELASITPATKKVPPVEKKIKVSLKEYVKKVEQNTAPVVKKEKVAPPMPKGKQLKKIITKKPIVFKPQAKPKTTKLNPPSQPKPKKQKVKKLEPLPPVEPYIPYKEAKKKLTPKEEVTEMDWLTEDRSAEIKPEDTTNKFEGASAGRSIEKLYGSDFGKLSAGQQKYILDNQEIMRRITQEVLNRQASVANLNGINTNKSNVIEFYLHPNGNMTDFKFLQKSGYFLLDDITKSTMEYAYAKYPRPSEKTLIRYNVFYNLRSH